MSCVPRTGVSAGSLGPSPTRPSGHECDAGLDPYQGGVRNRLASLVLMPAFARGVRGCVGHSARWPSGMGRCTSARSARTRHRTRSSPDRRSGCPRCIETDAGNPVEVVPFAQPAQMKVLQVAVCDGRGAVLRNAGRAARDVDLAQRTAACRRCLPAKRPFSRRLREKADTVGRRGPTSDGDSREGRRP